MSKLKRIALAAFCCVTAATVLASCGKQLSVGSGESSSKAAVTSNAEESDVMNFTAPQKGDTIIEINFKDYGTVKFRLFPEYADKGVENFVELAKKGYYDGLTFHRIIKDFMIQGGDPLGTGTGGESTWGGKFDGGTDPHLIHAAGAVAYANSGSTATDGSQFYIVTGTVYDESDIDQMTATGKYSFSDEAKKIYTTAGGAPWLDGSYTVFGQVYEGLDVIFTIQNTATDASDKPLENVIMESVKVGTYDGEALHWYISDYDYEEPTEAPKENIDIANFTAPEDGEKIVVMNIKDHGAVKIKLFPEYADKGVENFLGLTEKGYYDGLTFHRVIKDFMIQGGDPEGTGMGGESMWGGSFDGGTDPHIIHAAGAVAYANSGSTSTNGSQFYIVTGEIYKSDELDALADYGYKFSENEKNVYSTYGGDPWLDGSYTVFGQVFDGLDIIFDLQNAETDENDKPLEDIIIESVQVAEYDGSELRWKITDYPVAEETTENGSEEATEATEAAEEVSAEENTEAETSAEETAAEDAAAAE